MPTREGASSIKEGKGKHKTNRNRIGRDAVQIQRWYENLRVVLEQRVQRVVRGRFEVEVDAAPAHQDATPIFKQKHLVP